MQDKAQRVLAIGLDSAEPSLIERWVEEGKLPVFKRLMKEGCYGRLNSTLPPLTPPAWTSALTGVNPGKHNIYDFFRVTERHGKEIVSSGDRKSKGLWQLLDEAGLASLIINLPNTYPADLFNGVMVAGMPAPRTDAGFVSPASMRDEILNVIDNKRLGISETHMIKGDVEGCLKDLREVTERISKLAHHLIRTRDWNLCTVVFDDLDRLQHVFWHHMDPSHPFYDPENAPKYKDVLLGFYQFLEKQIASFLPLLDDGRTLLAVFSDHGMGAVRRNFSANTFFRQKGWLQTKQPRVDVKQALTRTGISFEGIRIFLDRIHLRPLLRRIVPLSAKRLLRQWVPAEGIDLEMIDWSNTLDWKNSKAYLCSRTGHGILINRENVSDYESFRDEVILALTELRDPDTGSPVVKKVYRREEVYQGPHVAHAPDLVVEAEEDYQIQERISEAVTEPLRPARVPISANHRQEGIVLLSGAGLIRAGHRLATPDIVDIAPTVLYGMGLPIPREMDGKPIADAFREEVLGTRPPTFVEQALQTEKEKKELTAEEEEAIQARLRDLGYVE